MDTQEHMSGGEGGEILPISAGVTADSLAQKHSFLKHRTVASGKS